MWVGSCCGHRGRTHSEAAPVLPETRELPREPKASKRRFRVWTKEKTSPAAPPSPRSSVGSLTAWQLLASEVLANPIPCESITHPDPSAVSTELASPPSAQRAAFLITGAPSSDASIQKHGELRMQAYELHNPVGQGAFGTVFRAIRRIDRREVCMKRLNTGMMSLKQKQATREEVALLERLHHPNIVEYFECFWTGSTQNIVMEFCEGGDLDSFIRQRGDADPLAEDEIMLIFVQLCLALQYVHSQNILHRDIKPGNIFCSRGGIIKLGDFGLGRSVDPEVALAHTLVGTPYYLSPEAVQESIYGSKSDIWAAGCVLYELASLQRPFQGHSVSAVVLKILRASPAPLPSRFSEEFCRLVDAMLLRNPDDRPSMTQILELEYVQRHVRRYREQVSRGVAATHLGATQLPPTAPITASIPLDALLGQIQRVLHGGVNVLRTLSQSDDVERHRRRVALQDCFEELAHHVASLNTAVTAMHFVHAT